MKGFKIFTRDTRNFYGKILLILREVPETIPSEGDMDYDKGPENPNLKAAGNRVRLQENCAEAWHLAEHGKVILPEA